MRICPECGSQRTWKDGLRHVQGTPVQRYLCRSCGYRFSDPTYVSKDPEPVQNFHGLALNRSSSLLSNRQICATQTTGAKNLVRVEPQTEIVRTSPIAEQLVNYILYLKRLGRTESTISTYNRYITIISNKSNLNDPDEIALFIRENWKENSTRNIAVYAYDAFLKSVGKQWTKPDYKPESKKPFIPTDEELSQVVMTGNKSSIAFSRLLYETGCRTNEAERLEWDDIDYAREKIYIRASKRGNARFITITNVLLNMLCRLPRSDKQKIVFPKREKNSRRAWFNKRMKRLARLLNNTRFLKIHFHTFRHCKALREYHRTKDILHIKTLLGHKSLLTTQHYVELYTQIYGDNKAEQFITKIAATKEERITLMNDGWTFIKNDDEEWYFRKPK